jgi:hypothetical protein
MLKDTWNDLMEEQKDLNKRIKFVVLKGYLGGIENPTERQGIEKHVRSLF